MIDLAESADLFPRLLTIDFCVYSLLENKVEKDVSLIIKTEREVDEKTFLTTGVN